MKKPSLVILLLLGTLNAESKECSINSVLRNAINAEKLPESLQLVSSELRTLDKNLIQEVQNGKKMNYWVDHQNQIRFSDLNTGLTDDSSFVVMNDSLQNESYIIKEFGELNYDSKNKKFLFSPKNSWDLKPGEIDETITSKLNLKFERKINPSLEKARVVKCVDLLAQRERGDDFIKDSFMISGIVTTAGFVTANPDVLEMNFQDPEWQRKAKLLSSDLVANMSVSLISSKFVKPLVVNNVNIFKDFFQRTTIDFGTNLLIKRPILNAMNKPREEDKEKKSFGNQTLPYDTMFSVLRFFPKRAVQRWTIHSLPKLLLASCLKNSKLDLIVGPRMIRLADQYTAGVIYMSGRNLWLDDSKKTKAEENQK